MNTVACPSCAKKLKYNPQLAGKQVRCPSCKTGMILPGAPPANPPVDPLMGGPIQPPPSDPLAPIGQALPQSASPLSGSNNLPPNRYLEQPHQGNHGQPIQQPSPGKLPKLPKGFTVEQGPNHLSMITPGSASQFGTFGFIALFTILCASISLPLILSVVLGPSIISRLLVWGIAPLGFFGVIYLIVAAIMNRRVVEVSGDFIKVKVKGPAPFPSFAQVIRIQSVQQIYVVRRTYLKRINQGLSSIWEVASTAIAAHDGLTNGWFCYSYHVFALLENGWRKELIGGDIGPKGAKFLERSVERFLGISNRPVVSTWYQKFFYRESTMDERAKNLSGENLRAKCLYLPQMYSLFATFALFVSSLVVVGILFVAVTASKIDDPVARNRTTDNNSNTTVDSTKNGQSIKSVSSVKDDFGDGTLDPLWKSTATDGLTIKESDGVVKISGMVPNHPERYVNAKMELSDSLATNQSFVAEIDVLATSGTFGGARHRGRGFSFLAVGGNNNNVGVQFWGNQYKIVYDRGNGQIRKYARPNGDEMTTWYRWRIEYYASTRIALVFINDRQIGGMAVDLGASVNFEIRLSCVPKTNIEGSFDNFRVKF